jgi:type IV secretory pathway component VirB8
MALMVLRYACANTVGRLIRAEMNAVRKLAPWRARPLYEAAKNEKFRQVMDLSAERVLLGRSAIMSGWIIGAGGAACFAASIFGWVTLLPLKTTVVEFFLADKSTGIISAPVSLADAPKLFGEATDDHYLKLYVEAREQWIPEMDEVNDHLAKLMSTPAEQNQIVSARKLPDNPVNAIGKDGHISLADFRFHPQASGKDGTKRYLVQFERSVWKSGYLVGTTPWSATVDFQWHPELPMLPADRADNPGGFQALSYSASSDVPDTKRQ